MKKIISIALLCAMLLSCFAGCAMQKGEVDVESYVEEAEVQNTNTTFRTELQSADEYSGTPDTSWFEGASKTKKYTLTSAEQLVGFRNLIAADNTFSGWEITLDCDVDLKGTSLEDYGEKGFNGKFFGGGHVIANWKVVASSDCVGFFCSLASNSVIDNVSFINGTITSDGYYSNIGLFGKGYAGEGCSVTISNVYSQINITSTKKTTKIDGKQYYADLVGGILGAKHGMGSLTIQNCEFNGKLDTKSAAVGGILGKIVAPSKDNTETKITGYVTVPESDVIGGNVSVVIENCKVTSEKITGTTQVGGILGWCQARSDYGLLVKNCSVNSNTVATNTMSGGLVGYVDKAIPVVIIGCDVAGSYEGHRTSGGIIGTLNAGGKPCAIRDCNVTADLTFALDDKKNNCGGGLIGKVDGVGTFVDIANCHVDSKMTATYNPKTKDGDYSSGAGGLIGRVFNKSEVVINNCSVDGEFKFIYKTLSQNLKFYTGRLIGSIGVGSGDYNVKGATKVTFGENIIVSPDLKVTFDGDSTNFNYESECCAPEIAAMGYQTRVNKDNKDAYDLRYVFAISDSVANTADVGVGATVTIRFVDSTGKLNEKTQTAYASEIYTAIVDEDEKTYSAEAFNYKYVYTVVIEGIPAGYTFDANNVEITLDAFSATKTGDVVTTLESCTLVHGQIVTNP